MKHLTFFYLICFSITTLILVGCEDSTDDKTNQAQVCLNNADTSTQAADCLTIVEGIGGQKAARIRCALTFILNGLTQQQIIDTFKNLEEPPTNDSPFAYLYSGLAIGDVNPADGTFDGAARVTAADDQLVVCEEANSPSMTSIAHISRMGTYTQSAVDANGGDITNIADMIANGNLADIPDDVIIQMGAYTFAQYCNGGNEGDSEICETLVNAGYGTETDNAVLANNLRACFENNTCN